MCWMGIEVTGALVSLPQLDFSCEKRLCTTQTHGSQSSMFSRMTSVLTWVFFINCGPLVKAFLRDWRGRVSNLVC